MGFTSPVTDHGFRAVDDAMCVLPDSVHLGRLPAITVNLTEIAIASQPVLDPALVRRYAANPPKHKRILLRPYGDDEIAVADGHHTIAAARLRGDTTIRARWIDEDND